MPHEIDSFSGYGIIIWIGFGLLEGDILQGCEGLTYLLGKVGIFFFALQLSLVSVGVVGAPFLKLVLFVLRIFIDQECLLNFGNFELEVFWEAG